MTDCQGSTRWGVCSRRATMFFRDTAHKFHAFCWQHVPQPLFRKGWESIEIDDTPFEFEPTLQDGDRVRHPQSGATGTVAGSPRPMRTAGDVLFVRVIWDHPFKLDRGSMEAVQRLERIER